MSGVGPDAAPVDLFADGLKEAIDAIRAMMAADSGALEEIIQGSSHARATLGMAVCVVHNLITRAGLSPVQQAELLDAVHADLVDQMFIHGPGQAASGLEEALSAILREGGGARGG